jgi:hypothetical protein
MCKFLMILYLIYKVYIFLIIKILFCRTPPNTLTPNIHYENLMNLFGKEGHFCTNIQQIRKALSISLQVFIIYIYYLIFKCQ